MLVGPILYRVCALQTYCRSGNVDWEIFTLKIIRVKNFCVNKFSRFRSIRENFLAFRRLQCRKAGEGLVSFAIVEFARAYSRPREMEGGGVCMRRTEYSSKHPSPLLPKSSVQKGGVYFRELTVWNRGERT